MRRKIQRVHFVGIGGIGMCGLAELLHNQGYRVSGSDLRGGATIERLRSLGIKIVIGHDASHVGRAALPLVNLEVETLHGGVVDEAAQQAERLAQFRMGFEHLGSDNRRRLIGRGRTRGRRAIPPSR